MLMKRFFQLNAPEGFTPYQGIPLRWRCSVDHPDLMAYFDPDRSTGFPLRVLSDQKTIGKGMDMAFYTNGTIARMMIDRHVIIEPEEQEAEMEKWFPLNHWTENEPIVKSA